jgi:protease-4
VDDRIDGVIFKISQNNSLGYAAIEEIRGAIHKIQEKEKTVFAYSDGLDRKSLFLASACDSIFMPISSEVWFIGSGITRSYVRAMLDKLGIKPNLHKIDEYKSAAEMVVREDMSPEAREMINWIMDDIWDVTMAALYQDRGISEEEAVEMMEYAMFMAEEAKDSRLIDEVLYWDELIDRLKDEDDEKLRTVSQSKYADVERKKVGLKGKKKIAVVHAQGTIAGRKSYIDPWLGIIMGHHTVGKDLRRVKNDDKVAAVVFRVDSPGGESLASDFIGREITKLSAEKPVVASMVNVAASGGYHITFVADKIVADPSTITGSIGSISGKFNTEAFYNKLGITYDHVYRGPNADMWSAQSDFSPEQRKRFEENHWQGFNMWLENVSEKRGIPMEELRTLAMGRVWTGKQALENGLIDELGGLDRAIELAKELADIPADEGVTIVHYPKSKSLIEMITSGGGPLAAVRWVLFRFIREDVEQTLRLLATGAYELERMTP